ncbi:MAG: NCS2 family permease [Acidimicrobiia bacterium]|nr:NCS2 family permease [Acidimicrobiia bacterium]MDH5503113.1 NCS2 family permease [Acidimicrobiia bacterium]
MADTADVSTPSGLDAYFKISERGSTVGTEVRAGVATFLVMAYIIFVNPSILSEIGFDTAALAAGTALVAGILCIAMGVVSNYPLAMAAGLGINAAVAFGLVFGQGLTPQGAMGVIVLEGILVTVLVVLGLREKVMDAVPASLKYAIGVGIGLFILFIGFVNGGLIQQGEGTPVEFVFPNSKGAVVTLIGLVITVFLYTRGIKGSLVISIVATTVVALIMGVATMPDSLSAAPSFSTLGEFDLGNVFETLGFLAAILTIFTFMLTDFFDTMGTATAIAEQAELIDDDGRIPDVGKLLLVDSVGAALGGMAGVSSNTSYIESSAGVAEGGRTGLTSVVVGLLFLVSIFLSPVATLIPSQATAPVLILVGFLMASLITKIDFADLEEGFPALLAIVLMPLTYSITVGIGAGFVMYTLIKVARGKMAEVNLWMWVVTLAFVVYFMQSYLS